MADSLDLSLVPSELKDFAQTNRQAIISQILLSDMSFKRYMSVLSGVKNKVALTELFIGSVLQPGGKKAWNPTNGAVKFKPRYGEVKPCKVDLEFYEDQILALYQSYLGEINGKTIDPHEVPFVEFIIQKVIERAKEDLHLEAIYSGIHNAAGTSAVDTMDGILALRAAAITDGSIPAANVVTDVAGGADVITEANAYDQIRLVWKKVPDKLKVRPLLCIVSPSVKEAYNEDYKSQFGSVPYNLDPDKQKLDGTNCTFIEEPALAGKNAVIITPANNFFFLTDDENMLNKVKVEEAKRVTSLMIDVMAGVNFAVGELLFTNDPALDA